MPEQLEQLYQEARSALKAKDYVRAGGLLRQILQIDENYKDASRLLAQTVTLRRRRWYNDPRLWGTIGVVAIIALGFVLAPKVSGWFAKPEPITPTITVHPTSTVLPTETPIPTETVIPPPTSIPLAWKRISIGNEFPHDKIIAFEIDPQDQDVLYVNMENAGYYQSIDGGISWQPVQIERVPADLSSKLLVNNDHNEERGYTVTNIAPDGETRLYRYATLPTYEISGTGNWRVSKDNFKTWSEFGEKGSAAITFDSNGTVYVYCDTSLCKFGPDGKQRMKLGKPDVGVFTIIAISPNDSNTIYIAGRGLAVSKDGGLTWSKLDNGLGGILQTLESGEGNPPTLYLQIEKCDERNFPYITSENRVPEPGQPLYISNDGGQSWQLNLQTGCYLIKDADGVTLYRIGRAVEWRDEYTAIYWIWQSQDWGKLWEKVLVPTTPTTLTAHSTQGGLLYLYLDYDRGEGVNYHQYISEDHGHKWKAKNPESDIKLCYGSTLQFIDAYRPMAIDPRDGNHVFVIDNGALLESQDSCQTTYTFATPPNTSLNSIAFDPSNSDTLYAGTDGGAYISFDGGETWNQINDGLLGVTVVYSIVVDKDSNVYAATPYGIFKLEGR